MTKKITVGYDGSHASEQAVLWAADEAVARGCLLRIISCFTVPVGGDAVTGWVGSEAFQTIRDSTEAGLLDMKARCSTLHPGLEIVAETDPGSPVAALTYQSAPDDLIVVGSSSHGGAAAFWLGSTPRALVRQAPCPVVVVRGPTGSSRLERVVVGSDGSPGSAHALRWAVDHADAHDVPLVVVHGWQEVYPNAMLPSATDSSPARDIQQVDAARVLEGAVQVARERSRVDVTGKLVEADPATALIGSVHYGDLLVMGSRGRGALTSALFGSTVNEVLDTAAVPVVVVHDNPDETA